MAFVIEEEKRGIEWMPLLVGILAMILVGIGTYYLFFAEVPFIDSLTTGKSKLESSVAALRMVVQGADLEAVSRDPVFEKLQQQVVPLQLPNLGRSNPFAPF